MTLKTVNTNRCKGMAAVAEMLLAVDVRRIRGIADVAVDACRQAVLFRADTFVHGLVTLMKKILHVIFSHFLSRFNAALFLAEASLGLGNVEARGTLSRICIPRKSWRVNARQQAE